MLIKTSRKLIAKNFKIVKDSVEQQNRKHEDELNEKNAEVAKYKKQLEESELKNAEKNKAIVNYENELNSVKFCKTAAEKESKAYKNQLEKSKLKIQDRHDRLRVLTK